MTYKSVTVTQKGPPHLMRITENALREPEADEIRVKVLASFVCAPDITMRYGKTPFPPKYPFTPGYVAVGVVDAIGQAAADVSLGDRVGALTVRGGCAEYVYINHKRIVPVPRTVDPGEAATVILNYLVAHQTMHRTAKVKPGAKALIIGASGGIGTAYLQLGKLANLTMYGIASKRKHHILQKYGATPIDYHTEDFVKIVRKAEPDGLDVVFDGMGDDYVKRGMPLLRRGGMWVGYSNPQSYTGMFGVFWQLIWLNLLPNGKKFRYYGTGASLFNMRPFLEDWEKLFSLLEGGQITPVICKQYPLLEAEEANAFFESGDVVGHIVLLADR